MRMKQWEKQLFRQLKVLPRKERMQILEYYREMYGDKLEAGWSEEAILLEFGSPEDCARRILAEEREELDGAPMARRSTKKTAIGWQITKWILGILIIMPLALAFGGVIVAFGALSASGVGVALGGLFLCVWSAFQFAVASYGLAVLGCGLGLAGAGLLMLVGFGYATKYCAMGLALGLKGFWKGGAK